MLHGMEANAVNFADKAAHVAGHGVVGGAANIAMGGKFQDWLPLGFRWSCRRLDGSL